MRAAARWWTFAVVSLALFMGMLDNLVVTTALPSIQKALGASISDLEWTVNAYTLAFAVLMIPAAALGERIGRRRMLLIGVALFTAGSAAAALSTSAGALTLARALQGVGGAAITPLTLTILTRAFPAEQRAAAIGLWSGVSGLGLAAGPLVGGAIVSGWSWNAAFWINVPVGLVLLVLGRVRLEESHGTAQPIDVPGNALLGGGLLGLVYGLVRGNDLGWSSAGIVASLAVGAVLLAGFVLWEGRAAAPMIDLRLFTSRHFSVANGVGLLMGFGMFGSIFLITLYIQQVLGNSPLQAGLRTLPWTGTIIVVAPIAGILASRAGSRPTVLVGMLAQAAALAWIGAVSGPHTAYTTLLPAFLLGGFGMGLAFAPLSATVMGAVAGNRQDQASSVYNTLRELGGVFGIAILGAVFQHLAPQPTAFLTGFHAAVYAGAGVLAGGVLISVLLPGRTQRQALATAIVEEPTAPAFIEVASVA
jgi:EmrB/QacA subfamily drug resistance transporter